MSILAGWFGWIYKSLKVNKFFVASRNLNKNQQKLKLEWYRDNDIEVQNLLRLLSGLRYVPIEAIDEVLDQVILVRYRKIVDRIPEEEEEENRKALVSALVKYLDYFIGTYVGFVDPVTKQRGKPKFCPTLEQILVHHARSQ